MPEPVAASQVLAALILCGIMGLLGQGVRATIGLKNAKALDSTTPGTQSTFSAAYFVLSLMIGFIAGVLAGLGIGLDKFMTVDLGHLDLLLGVAASGYVGADFIENSLSLVIPAAKPAAAADVVVAVTPASTPPVPPTPQPAPPPAPPPVADAMSLISSIKPAIDPTLLTAALKIVQPGLDAASWVPALTPAFAKFGLNTNRMVAAAIGQFMVEAGPTFNEIRENLNYTHAERLVEVFPKEFATVADAKPYVGKPEAIGNRVYANRLGNGDEASGDGFRFRGRGLIQLTGRSEYAEFGSTIGKTAEDAAAYCETFEGAAMSGCWYLSSRGCLPLADAWELSAITKKVNGAAILGNAQRIAYATAMLKHLGG